MNRSPPWIERYRKVMMLRTLLRKLIWEFIIIYIFAANAIIEASHLFYLAIIIRYCYVMKLRINVSKTWGWPFSINDTQVTKVAKSSVNHLESWEVRLLFIQQHIMVNFVSACRWFYPKKATWSRRLKILRALSTGRNNVGCLGKQSSEEPTPNGTAHGRDLWSWN